jgi:hypothetical protein
MSTRVPRESDRRKESHGDEGQEHEEEHGEEAPQKTLKEKRQARRDKK